MAQLSYARTYAAPLDVTFTRVLGAPLESVLGRRHLAIPGITKVEQSGAWGAHVGQRRTLLFTDGGRVTEVLTELDVPNAFGYDLAEVKGPMKLLIRTVAGRWAFAPDGDGTTVTWTWDLVPTLVGRAAMPAFGAMWRGMAAKAFDRLGPVVTG